VIRVLLLSRFDNYFLKIFFSKKIGTYLKQGQFIQITFMFIFVCFVYCYFLVPAKIKMLSEVAKKKPLKG